MKDISAIPTLAQPAASLALPEQLAQQAADAVRELLDEAAAANTGLSRDTCNFDNQNRNSTIEATS